MTRQEEKRYWQTQAQIGKWVLIATLGAVVAGMIVGILSNL